MDLGLLMMCVISFAAVFVLLTVLSIMMTVLTAVFPHKGAHRRALPGGETDAAVLAAITTTMNQLYPGTSVTKIEEVR